MLVLNSIILFLPILLPLFAGFHYGYNTKRKGTDRLRFWAIISLSVGFVYGLIIQYTSRGWCSISGGPACPVELIPYLTTAITFAFFEMVLGYVFLYLGVQVKNRFG